jgi:hypothetical protein
MAADAGELKARATLDNTEFLGALKEMVGKIQENSENAAKHIEGMSGALAQVGTAVEGLAITEKIISFGEECLAAAEKTNKLKAAFEGINGVTQSTTDLFEGLSSLEFKSMYDFEDTLGPAAQNMLKLGVSAEQTSATMKALVDAAAGMKEGPAYITEVSNTIATMQSHIVASGKDMKALQAEGIDAWGALAREIGTSVPEAQEKVKKGMIDAQTVTQAVTAEMGSRFAGAAELTQTTFRGAMHTLEEAGEEAQVAIGQSILAVLNDLAPAITGIANLLLQFKDYWDGLSEPVKNAVIALGAALVVVGSIAAALPLLSAAAGGIAAIFGGWTLPIVAAVAALALIGKWIYDEWPAIKAVFIVLWDDITTVWNNVVTALSKLFSPLIAIWTAEWNIVKSVLGAVWDWIKEQVQGIVDTVSKVVGAVVGFFGGMPGEGELSKLAAAWKKGQEQIDATAAATAAHTKEINDNRTASAALVAQRRAQEAADLAAANRAKEAAAEAKKAAEEAKKKAAEEQKYNEDLRKTYEALYAIAPDVAKHFSDMYGGINTDAINAQKLVGAAWNDIGAAEQKAIIDTLALGEAYKTLGETSAPRCKDRPIKQKRRTR